MCYNTTRGLVRAPGDIGLLEPDVYLFAFATVGTAAAFTLEQFARLLFLRERDLDRERQRGDALLRNVPPEAIINRLKMREPGIEDGRIAERYAEATVLFADLVGFTERAARMDSDELIAMLDGVFIRWDELADRFGLEKIKTIGDAYMAVAGVPEARADHVEAAADMSLEIRDSVSQLRWPTGVPISVRIGIACGPVIAGVIGHRKFAYDIGERGEPPRVGRGPREHPGIRSRVGPPQRELCAFRPARRGPKGQGGNHGSFAPRPSASREGADPRAVLVRAGGRERSWNSMNG